MTSSSSNSSKAKDLKNLLTPLEKTAKQLEISAPNRQSIFDKAVAYTEQYLENLKEATVYYRDYERSKTLFDHPINEEAVDFNHLLTLYKDYVEKDGLNAASGGHLGYIPGGGLYPAALGDFIADVTNRYAGVFFANPGAVRMENMMIRWMRDLVGFPETTEGHLASGGSMASLSAIVTARDAYELKGADFANTVVYMTDQVHHAIHKALRIGGLGEVVQRAVPMDEGYRMIPKALKAQIEADRKEGLKPWMVVGSAGTTDVGAVDPIEGIAEITRQQNLWLHLDAAYGGFFLLCESGQERLKGLDQADSIVMDPHKGLFLPYGTGALLVKKGQYLHQSHYYKAAYMQDADEASGEISPSELSPELTKHFRGLRMWLPLKLFGLKAFRAALEEKIQLARYFYERLRNTTGIEVGPYPDLSVVLFRYVPESGDPDDFNARLIQAVHEDGRIFMSSTTIEGHVYLRAAILSFRTHLATMDQAYEVLMEKVEELED